jgi:hypothetical protein
MDPRRRRKVVNAAFAAFVASLLIGVSPLAVDRLYARQICCVSDCLFGECEAQGFCDCSCVMGMPVCTCGAE